MKSEKKELIIASIKSNLGANYREDDDQILEEIFDEVSSIASNISNRSTDDEKLFPYIKKATKSMYLSRGAEGIKSKSESGVSDTFEDIVEVLRNDIVKNGLRRLK